MKGAQQNECSDPKLFEIRKITSDKSIKKQPKTRNGFEIRESEQKNGTENKLEIQASNLKNIKVNLFSLHDKNKIKIELRRQNSKISNAVVVRFVLYHYWIGT